MSITACPFCKGTNSKSTLLEDTFFNGRLFKYKQCKNCSLIFVSPQPTADDYEKMYPVEYQGEFDLSPSKKYEAKIKLIKDSTCNKRLLDYGCGAGKFLNESLAEGFECTGVEYNPALVKLLWGNFPSMKFYTIEDFFYRSEKYDIIHLSNVLEHLTNPKEIMEKLKEKLEPNGIFVIEGPIENNFSLNRVMLLSGFGLRKSLGKVAHHPPRHLFHANYKNQLAFFDQLGLKKIYYKIGDSAWPLPSNISEANTIAKKLMYYFGRLSVNVSKLNSNWGNKFIYIGKR